jgi:hypothetical protein
MISVYEFLKEIILKAKQTGINKNEFRTNQFNEILKKNKIQRINKKK